MNFLVTGANGQLGNELRRVSINCPDRFVFSDVVEASYESTEMLNKLSGNQAMISTVMMDITDIDAIREIVERENIDVIINCAAYTNVDAAEDNYQKAELLNAKAPRNLAVVSKEMNCFLVHISTDYVFGGEVCNTPCKETQKGTPIGVYGLTKLHGEEAIHEVGCRYAIIRTSWLYSEFGKNFVRTMLNLTATRPSLKVVFDQVGTPTYARDLAEAAYLVAKENERIIDGSVYHFSNEGVCSWFDFAKMIACYAGNGFCEILPCHSDEFPSKVKRPAFSVLDKTKIKESFCLHIPYWTDSLKDCINRLKVL